MTIRSRASWQKSAKAAVPSGHAKNYKLVVGEVAIYSSTIPSTHQSLAYAPIGVMPMLGIRV